MAPLSTHCCNCPEGCDVGSYQPDHNVSIVHTLLINGDEDSPLIYTVNDDTVTITDCDESASGTLVIPSIIEGKPVTSIGDDAFSNCTGLRHININGNVTNIGSTAFRNCTGLTNISLPDSVTSIGGLSFYNCISLPIITLPDSVISIGGYAFQDCTTLQSVYMRGNAPSVGESIFYDVHANAKVYQLRGTTGYGDTFGGLPVVFSGLHPASDCGRASPHTGNGLPIELVDTVTVLDEDTDTSNPIKIGDIVLTEFGADGGTNAVLLSGTDASSFEVVGSELFLKAGVALDYETIRKTALFVRLNVRSYSGRDQTLWYVHPQKKDWRPIEHPTLGDYSMSGIGTLFVGLYHYQDGGGGELEERSFALPPARDILSHFAGGYGLGGLGTVVLIAGTNFHGDVGWVETCEIRKFLEQMGSTIEWTGRLIGGRKRWNHPTTVYRNSQLKSPLLDGIQGGFPIQSAIALEGGIPLIQTVDGDTVVAVEYFTGGKLIVASSENLFRISDETQPSPEQHEYLQQLTTNIIEHGCEAINAPTCPTAVTVDMGAWDWPHSADHEHIQSAVPLTWGADIPPFRGRLNHSDVKVKYKGYDLSNISGVKQLTNLREIGGAGPIWYAPRYYNNIHAPLFGDWDFANICVWGWWETIWDVYNHSPRGIAAGTDYQWPLGNPSPPLGGLFVEHLGSFQTLSIETTEVLKEGHTIPAIPDDATHVTMVRRGAFCRLASRSNAMRLDVFSGVTWAWHDMETGTNLYPVGPTPENDLYGVPYQHDTVGMPGQAYISSYGRYIASKEWLLLDDYPLGDDGRPDVGSLLSKGNGTGISSTDRGGSRPPYPGEEQSRIQMIPIRAGWCRPQQSFCLPRWGRYSEGNLAYPFSRKNAQPPCITYYADKVASGLPSVTLRRLDVSPGWSSSPLNTFVRLPDDPQFSSGHGSVYRQAIEDWGIVHPDEITVNMEWE